jgi:protein SCO1/2
MRRAVALCALALAVPYPAIGHDVAALGFDEHPGAVVPRETIFRDEEGGPIPLGDLVRLPTILAFEYYTCSDGCGLLMANLATALHDVDAEPGVDYRVLTVSFDPADTPDLAAQKRDLALAILDRPADPGSWHFLTGDDASIRALTQAVGFGFDRHGEDYVHPLGAVVLSPEGKIVRYLRGERFLPADLKLTLMEASAGIIGPTISRIARFCFSVDPQGRGLTFNTLRVTGTVTLTVAASMFVLLIVRSRRHRTGGRTD